MIMNLERVGKYRIIAPLGQGGMASVYLSVVPGPMGVNKLLVLKLLREELSLDEDFLAMFLNEARLAARLNHANVVQTYEVGFESGIHFLAMDFLDGQPLHAVLRRAGAGGAGAGVPLDIQVRILAETLAGLHYAHTLADFDGTKLHVVHRDVSPQNVFITYDGQVKVVDFGIAKAAGAVGTTQSGMFKGKLAYVAPEQANGDPVDARADVFGVGVMLWEAIAGRRLARGDSQSAMLSRRLAGTEPRIREEVSSVDAEIADICDKAMAHRANDRFASAEDFRAALEGYLARTSPRTGAREVGQFVEELFVAEREKLRVVIDEQMKRIQREASTAMLLPLMEADPRSSTGRMLIRDDEIITVTQRVPRRDRYVWVTSEQPGSNEWSLFLATTLEVIERGETGIAGQVSALVGVDGRANNPEYQQLCDIEVCGTASGLMLVNSAMLYLLPVLQTPGLPRVAIGASLPHASLVQLDFMKLIERASARVLERGQHIAVMSPHAPKLTAAQECLEARGLHPERLLTMPAAPIGCERLTEMMFDRRKRPDAVFVMDDNLVAPLLAGLQRAGVQPGKDVYVLAHCNWPRPLGLAEGVEHIGFDVREVLCAGKELIDAHRAGTPYPTRTIPPRLLGELTRPLQMPSDVNVKA
ncbi:serine/threonine protein kinase [Minicystis rosea]|nr:serine/threonine protein kinase [Minicystis rosea]